VKEQIVLANEIKLAESVLSSHSIELSGRFKKELQQFILNTTDEFQKRKAELTEFSLYDNDAKKTSLSNLDKHKSRMEALHLQSKELAKSINEAHRNQIQTTDTFHIQFQELQDRMLENFAENLTDALDSYSEYTQSSGQKIVQELESMINEKVEENRKEGNAKVFDKIVSQVSQGNNAKKSSRRPRKRRMSMISEKEIKEKRKRLRIDETLNVHYEIDSKQQKSSEVKQKRPESKNKKFNAKIGVTCVKKKFVARIWIPTDNTQRHLGTFDTQYEAAQCYDFVARNLGKSQLNFPRHVKLPKFPSLRYLFRKVHWSQQTREAISSQNIHSRS